jgi:imidazoleglycerol phosphate dehydratase HisB
VGALISVDRLEVHHVTDHVILVGDAIAAMHVAGDARDVERFAAIVPLEVGKVASVSISTSGCLSAE